MEIELHYDHFVPYGSRYIMTISYHIEIEYTMTNSYHIEIDYTMTNSYHMEVYTLCRFGN
jgi:hypothetical protein